MFQNPVELNSFFPFLPSGFGHLGRGLGLPVGACLLEDLVSLSDGLPNETSRWGPVRVLPRVLTAATGRRWLPLAHPLDPLIQSLDVNVFGFGLQVGSLDHFFEHFNFRRPFSDLILEIFDCCLRQLLDLNFALNNFFALIFGILLGSPHGSLRLLKLVLILLCCIFDLQNFPIFLLK